MHRIGLAQRRARLAVRHLLAPAARAASSADVAEPLVALHATDPASVMLAALARSRSGGAAAVEHALYEQRSLMRLLGMRRTVFVVPTALAPVVQVSSTAALVARERARLVAQIEDAGIAADGSRWLRRVDAATLAALRARGVANATQLSEDVPELRQQLVLAVGKPYETRQRLATRVLFMLAAQGLIVRGRPSGSWTSSQYRWEPIDAWLPDGWPDLPVAAAQAELMRRWLCASGPATVADLTWWTGWTVREVRRALQELATVEVALDDGQTGLVLADDVDDVAVPDPWIALLPALDPTPMGWRQRDWFLGEHRAALFDRSGNIGPTVWWDGRIVGGWAQRRDGEIRIRLLADVGSEAAAAAEDAAAQLAAALAASGSPRVTPRFRTPLERELAAGQ